MVDQTTGQALLVDAALRSWQTHLDRAGQLFQGLTDTQLQREIAPGKNRLLYLFGHLAAVNDAMLPLLGLGARLHPELEEPFIKQADRATPDTLGAAELTRLWDEIHAALAAGFATLSASDWHDKHTAVSAEAFTREPHRNRFAVLLSRTAHIAYHHGQAVLADRS